VNEPYGGDIIFDWNIQLDEDAVPYGGSYMHSFFDEVPYFSGNWCDADRKGGILHFFEGKTWDGFGSSWTGGKNTPITVNVGSAGTYYFTAKLQDRYNLSENNSAPTPPDFTVKLQVKFVGNATMEILQSNELPAQGQ
jgi:hypothetical protein